MVDATTVAAAPAPPATSAEGPAATQSAGTPDIAELQQPSNSVAKFTPPFPQRVELFEPPQRAEGAASRDDGVGATVELKGFIVVDEPRVILSIDGVVSSVPEGGEKYGVRVISIDPPTAILQRGGRPWPATLE
jgi:hypothetical protein